MRRPGPVIHGSTWPDRCGSDPAKACHTTHRCWAQGCVSPNVDPLLWEGDQA